MKVKRARLSRLYHTALNKYLKLGANATLEPARELGRRAVEDGLETLDMARMHEIALVSLLVPGSTNAGCDEPDATSASNHLGSEFYAASAHRVVIARAGIFFAEALTPIEQTHRGAREANSSLNQMIAALSQQTLALAASNDDLKQEIEQRKTVEESLRTSELTTSRLLEKSRQMQEELRHLSRKLLSVQEEERRLISRELHDVIAQTLTSINVRLSALSAGSTASTKELQKKIALTQRLVARSVDVVHRFARELRPTVLDDLGIIPALQSFMKTFTENSGVRVSLKAFAGVEKLDGDRRTVLYRVAQEALTNVARHAKASRAEVVITDEKKVISMEIKDNGKGFDVDGKPGAKKTTRLGLLGMRERVEMVGGTFCVISSPGHPTTVRVEIPTPRRGTAKTAAPTKSDANSTLECP